MSQFGSAGKMAPNRIEIVGEGVVRSPMKHRNQAIGKAKFAQRRTLRAKEMRRRELQRRLANPESAGQAHEELFLHDLFEDCLHAKQLEAMKVVVLGLLTVGMVGIALLGREIAKRLGASVKSAIKRVDRFLGNEKLKDEKLQGRWVASVLQGLAEVVVALDWTDFDADGHVTLSLQLVGAKGRATPLMWKTIEKKKLKKNQTRHEDDLLRRFKGIIGPQLKVILLADRGFKSVHRFRFLESLGFYYAIRFRGNTWVSIPGYGDGKAQEFVRSDGRAQIYRDVKITAQKASIPAIVTVHDKEMKDPWYLAVNLPDEQLKGSFAVRLYGKRFTIEETFRDHKDPHFGMGMSQIKTTTTARRDRYLLLQAIAHHLLEKLGAAGERLGFDRMLQANTSKVRQHSLFHQGQFWFSALANLPKERALKLLQAFGEELREHCFFSGLVDEILWG